MGTIQAFIEQQPALLQRMDDMQRRDIALSDALLERLSVPTAGSRVNGNSGYDESALRTLQEKDSEFLMYDGNAGNFLPWLVTVQELKNARTFSDHVAVVYAKEELGTHARGIVRPEQVSTVCTEIVTELRKKFCPLTWDFNVVCRLEQLKMRSGDFQEYQGELTTEIGLLDGTHFESDVQLMYLFLKGLEADIEANVMSQRPETLEAEI